VHRGQYAVAGAKDLTLCLDGQQGEQRSVGAIAEVGRSAGAGSHSWTPCRMHQV